MKKSEWSDKQLEELLQQMPQVKDRLSPDELYRKINARLQEEQVRKKKAKTWVLPSIAAVAAVLLIMVIGPSFLNYSGGSLEESAGEKESSEKIAILEGEQDSTSVADKEEQMGIASTEESTELRMATPVINQILKSTEGTYVTIGVVDEQISSVVPITILTEETETSRIELVERALDQLHFEDFGLAITPLSNLDFVEVGDHRVEVIFPLDFVSNGFEDIAYYEGIIETLRWMNYQEVTLKMQDGSPVELGQYGQIDSIDLSTTTRKGYFTTTSGNGATYLVPSNAKFTNFEEALEGMKLNENQLQPSIPFNITIETSEVDKDSVSITFGENEINQEDTNHLLMIKAILLTAKEFGYQDVTFINTPEQMDGLELQVKGQPNRIQVPLAPNHIDFTISE